MAKQYVDGINIIEPKNEYAKGRMVINLNEFIAFAKRAVADGWSSDATDREGNLIVKKDGTNAQCLWMDLKESRAGGLYLEQWKPDAPKQPEPEVEVEDEDIPF